MVILKQLIVKGFLEEPLIICKFIVLVLVKKVNRDPVEMATNYLFKLMQSEEFSREIAYLKSPSSFNETPKLVSNC